MGTAEAFSNLGLDISMLHKPDLLHGIYLGMVKHILGLLEGFLKKHKRSARFDEAWVQLKPYPGFYPFHLSYSQTSHWMGKEMRNAVKVLCAVLAVALHEPATAAEKAAFTNVQECTKAFIDFVHLAQYPSHNDETLDLMEDFLRTFHKTKEVFRPYRATKQTSREAVQYRAEQAEALKAAIGQMDLTTAARQALQRREKEIIENTVQDFLSDNSDFNFIKMHLMLHYRESIEEFGTVRAFSTEVGEAAHVEQMKEGWYKSNHIDAYRQILQHRDRKHQFRMRSLNLIELAKQGLAVAKLTKVFPELLPHKRKSVPSFMNNY